MSAQLDQVPVPQPPRRRSRLRRALIALAGLLAVYLLVAYVILPLGWLRYAHRHPALDDIPRITYTRDDIPGDPLNVALIGTETQLKKIMLAAKWYPADPLTLKSCLGMADAAVLKRPYDDAPVSSLYFEGRKEALAFEQPVGDSPRHRHHVRFWKLDKVDADGRPVWVGSAVYDERVGLSRTTGEVTHVTAPDVDAERDYLFRDLEQTGDLAQTDVIDDFHKVREGRNGGGDPWRTDGKLYVGVIAAKSSP
ncbi:MAG TPA: LssY C-terminal domain-containing protein [Gemmataceae bacterium]|nr:LssY C-terminal domain-containing protein [Gemmataceae bacterium]